MLLVNYWNSTICTVALMPDGQLGGRLSTYDPKGGRQMSARADQHVNHSRNDADAQAAWMYYSTCAKKSENGPTLLKR